MTKGGDTCSSASKIVNFIKLPTFTKDQVSWSSFCSLLRKQDALPETKDEKVPSQKVTMRLLATMLHGLRMATLVFLECICQHHYVIEDK